MPDSFGHKDEKKRKNQDLTPKLRRLHQLKLLPITTTVHSRPRWRTCCLGSRCNRSMLTPLGWGLQEMPVRADGDYSQDIAACHIEKFVGDISSPGGINRPMKLTCRGCNTLTTASFGFGFVSRLSPVSSASLDSHTWGGFQVGRPRLHPAAEGDELERRRRPEAGRRDGAGAATMKYFTGSLRPPCRLLMGVPVSPRPGPRAHLL